MAYTTGTPLISSEIISIIVYWLSSFRLCLWNCIMAKSHHSVFYSHDKKTNAPFALVHSDVLVLPHFLYIMEWIGSLYSLMILPGWHEFICWNSRVMYVLCIVFSIKWCSHNLADLSRLFVLIMGVNISRMNWPIFCIQLVPSIKHLALSLLNRMGLLNRKTDIF